MARIHVDPTVMNKFSASQRAAVAAFVSVVVAVTVVGNALVIIAFATTRSLRTYNNQFILGLALADFLVGAVNMPLFGVVFITGRWPFSDVFCDVFTFCDHAFSHISVVSVAIISLDRFVALVYPFHHRSHWRRRSRALLLVSIAYLVPVLIWLPPTLLWDAIYYGSTENDTKLGSNTTSGADDCLPDYVESLAFSIISPVLFFWIPFTATTLLYAKICLVIWHSLSRKRNIMFESDCRDGTPAVKIQSSSRLSTDSFPMPTQNSPKPDSLENPAPSEMARDSSGEEIYHSEASKSGYLISSSRQAADDDLVSRGSVIEYTFINPAYQDDCIDDVDKTSSLERRWTSEKSVNTLPPAMKSVRDAELRARSHSVAGVTRENIYSISSTEGTSMVVKQPTNALHGRHSISSTAKISLVNKERPKSLVAPSLGKYTEDPPISPQNHTLQINYTHNTRDPDGFVTACKRNHRNVAVVEARPQFSKVSVVSLDNKTGKGAEHLETKNVFLKRSMYMLCNSSGIRTLGLIIVAMFITWTPWAIVVIIFSLCPDCLPEIIYSVTVFLGYMNSTANPICYALADPRFKRAFKRLLCPRCLFGFSKSTSGTNQSLTSIQ
ncbi:muscarinic acetylcholine receptor M5-like [Diadema antillarum]|uniref:muscarinic acetylcholine receptor M5-like n=1 Tax=Diadema antillarum TaxID=105358 RepID=UPI003A87E8BF